MFYLSCCNLTAVRATSGINLCRPGPCRPQLHDGRPPRSPPPTVFHTSVYRHLYARLLTVVWCTSDSGAINAACACMASFTRHLNGWCVHATHDFRHEFYAKNTETFWTTDGKNRSGKTENPSTNTAISIFFGIWKISRYTIRYDISYQH